MLKIDKDAAPTEVDPGMRTDLVVYPASRIHHVCFGSESSAIIFAKRLCRAGIVFEYYSAMGNLASYET